MLADKPDFFARQMLCTFVVDPLGRTIGNAHP